MCNILEWAPRGVRFGPMSMSMSMFNFVGRLGIRSTFCSLFLSLFFFKILFGTQLCVLCVVLALINLLIFFLSKRKNQNCSYFNFSLFL